MKRTAVLATTLFLVLTACTGESPDSSETAPATAPGSDVGATGQDATATSVAGDTSATSGSHP